MIKFKAGACGTSGKAGTGETADEGATGFVSIHKACQGIRVLSGGYHWRYATEEEIKKQGETALS